MEKRVYLDTHIVVWLYNGEVNRFTEKIKKLINSSSLYVSEFVRLELGYLFEIGRIKEKADIIINTLSDEIGLLRCKRPMSQVVTQSLQQKWTRDPFDRIITSTASIGDDYLLTYDEGILKHYKYARKDKV